MNPHAIVAIAPAKVNLTLELLGKRPDGYHAIETLILIVDLFDTLEFQRTPAGFGITCDAPGVPTDERNLVWKAADALRRRTGTTAGAQVRLTKRIPHEAGLGGGSSDAAATLLALNELWRLNLSTAELAVIGATVGSDVPVFLTPPAGWCIGRGEQVEPISVGRPVSVVIVKPSFGLSTRAVYAGAIVPPRPQPSSSAVSALQTGDANGLGRAMFNRLEVAATRLADQIIDVLAQLRSCDPLGCQLSGSGAAVFAVCIDDAHANRVALAARANAPHTAAVFACRSWPR